MVDDEPYATELFKQGLRSGRFQMEFAMSTLEAIARVQSSLAASLILIFSDINMPGATGLEMLPKARLPAHLRRSRTRSATSASTSAPAVRCTQITGHTPTARRTGQLDPEQAFKVAL
jgi:CheY-like chemotaxis protein